MALIRANQCRNQPVVDNHLFIRQCHILLLKYTKSPGEARGSKELQFTITSVLMSSPRLVLSLQRPRCAFAYVLRALVALGGWSPRARKFFFTFMCRNCTHTHTRHPIFCGLVSNTAGWRLKPTPTWRWRNTHSFSSLFSLSSVGS